MIPQKVNFQKTSDINNALEILSQPDAKITLLAGGHSLIPRMKLRTLTPEMLLDITSIPELSGIEFKQHSIRIGATTCHSELLQDRELHREWPVFREVAKKIGDVQVRNRGTIGGSIACSAPTNEWLACLMVLEAKIELRSQKGRRVVNANEWITNHSENVLNSDELIVAIEIPRNLTNIKSGYAKLSHPASGAPIGAVVTLASAQSGLITFVRVAATGISSSPFRATQLEAALIDNRLTETDVTSLAHLISEDVIILEDSYANGPYRRHIAATQTSRALTNCFKALEE